MTKIDITVEKFEKFEEVKNNGGGMENFQAVGLSKQEVGAIACGYQFLRDLYKDKILEQCTVTMQAEYRKKKPIVQDNKFGKNAMVSYLERCMQMAWSNRKSFCQRRDVPKEGFEKEFQQAVEDCIIIDEIKKLVLRSENEKEQLHDGNCPFSKKDIAILREVIQEYDDDEDEITDYTQCCFPSDEHSPYMGWQKVSRENKNH